MWWLVRRRVPVYNLSMVTREKQLERASWKTSSLLREKWVGIDGVWYPLLSFHFSPFFFFCWIIFDIMASQAAAILRVIERKRQEKHRANLAKIQHIHADTPQHIYWDQTTHKVWKWIFNLIFNSNSCNQRVIITRCQLWACAFRKVVIYNTKEAFPFLENTPNNLSTISKWGRKRRYYI